jgi:hypothetical protein
MPDPTLKDVAEFLGYAIHFALIDTAAVRAWGDQIILAEEAPPLWAMDVACVSPANFDEVLRRVPGDLSADVAVNLVCSLLRRRWRANQLTVAEVRSMGWTLHCWGLLRTAPGQPTDWGAMLECALDDDRGGAERDKDLREFIGKNLEPYGKYEALLPSWIP